MQSEDIDLDLELTRDAIANDDMHAIQHVNSVDEIDMLWRELGSLQKEHDDLYRIVFQLTRALNAILPVPVNFDFE